MSRLLHPGASTGDILTIYINTIRALKILDPPGVSLSKLEVPLRIDTLLSHSGTSVKSRGAAPFLSQVLNVFPELE